MTSPRMDSPPQKTDPIRDRYYRPLELAEAIADWLFYIAAALSLLIPIIRQPDAPALYSALQVTFVLVVVCGFVLGWAVRFHFAPRAHARRFKDFLSHAYDIPLTDEKTAGYYTSSRQGVTNRIAVQLLENAFFSKDTTQRMLWWERGKVGIYAALFGIAILQRSTDLNTVGLVTQIVFSEQVLSRCLRTEWLWRQYEQTYEELFRLFQSRAPGSRLAPISSELLVKYETAKANACVTLSERIFNKRREANMREWARIKNLLAL
jgi:hypothetical protein